ncbi:putative nucleotidyltransferase substrate binding domain-containing protein [Viridibacterium curvum]|uniref:CBS domain-containing protein n=1 Tax=Viridibacterium curvum TaxID=1101404 RepID=A0ABP9QFX5_9RHOO
MRRSVTDEESLSSFSLYEPLRGLIRRSPVVYPRGTPLRVPVERMYADRIGSVVVADPRELRPQGIVTFSDLLGRVVLPGADLSAPIESAMDEHPLCLSADATAHDAMLAMGRCSARYVLVMERDGRLLGVVSRGDVYGAQKIVPEDVVNPLISARTSGELVDAAAHARHFVKRLISQGLGASQVIQWATSLNDFVGSQAVVLMKARFELPAVCWSWMAFGSEGRFEQTLSTDQDNGIIFEMAEGEDPEPVRQALLPFAQAVNQLLDECGFPLCRGQIMAGNAEQCLSDHEWRARFERWISVRDPKALLNASIFFDFRAIHGDGGIVDRLRSWLLERVAAQPVFLRMLAANALESAPPLGLLRAFVLERKGAVPGTIDLKKSGVRPCVDAARIFALSQGIAATSTVERLRAVAASPAFAGEDLQAAIDGFLFVQHLRLRNQQQHGGNESLANRLDPYKLNRLERHILRHAFRQIKQLQQRLRVDYRL